MAAIESAIGIEAPPRNTAKVPLPESSIIRKQPNGRAMLFVGDDVVHQELRCSSSMTQHVAQHSVFHSHALNARQDWASTTEVLCWHCCSRFDTPPVAIPRTYDAKAQEYVVYGNFCGFPCAKAFVLENDTFDTGLQLTFLEKMARELYGIPEIVANPPRLSLAMFGGPHQPDRFARGGGECAVHRPPFVCSYMVVEERQAAHNASAFNVNSSGTVRGIRRPAQPTDAQHVVSADPPPSGTSRYEKFLAEKGVVASERAASSSAPAAAPSKAKGTLAEFMKR